jgi:hypothetical protein
MKRCYSPSWVINTDEFSSAANYRCGLKAGSSRFVITNNELPIAPGTYRHILNVAPEKLAPHKNEDFYAELQSIRTALEYLPRRNETNPERIAERTREKEIIKRRLERRCEEAPQVQQAIADALVEVNGTPGCPRSFDRLDELLNDQAIVSASGVWPRKKSIIGVFLTSMISLRCGWSCRRFRRHPSPPARVGRRARLTSGAV